MAKYKPCDCEGDSKSYFMGLGKNGPDNLVPCCWDCKKPLKEVRGEDD